MCDLCRRSFMRGARRVRRGRTSGLSRRRCWRRPARGGGATAGARRVHHRQRLRDDDGRRRSATSRAAPCTCATASIVAVGKDVAGGGRAIDGTGMIVMPGPDRDPLAHVEHALPQLRRRQAGGGLFPDRRALRPADDSRTTSIQSTRLSAAEAINSGMTFVHSWCHNVRCTAHAEADIRALAETGIRARHSCGWPQGMPDTAGGRPGGRSRSLAKDWKSWSNEGLIGLGMAWRGQFRAGPIKPEVYQPEFDNARKLGVADHRARRERRARRSSQIEPLYKAKLMGKDVQLIHTLSANVGGARHDQGVGLRRSRSRPAPSCASATAIRRSARCWRRASRSASRSTPRR